MLGAQSEPASAFYAGMKWLYRREQNDQAENEEHSKQNVEIVHFQSLLPVKLPGSWWKSRMNSV